MRIQHPFEFVKMILEQRFELQQKAFPWGKVPPKGAGEGNAEGPGAVASERVEPSPSQGEGGPQGRMRVGLVGAPVIAGG